MANLGLFIVYFDLFSKIISNIISKPVVNGIQTQIFLVEGLCADL